MTWTELEDLFIQRVVNVEAVEQKRLIKNFRLLRKEIVTFLPEAAENPALLAETSFSSIPYFSYSNHYDVIKKIKVILKVAAKHQAAAGGAHADEIPFGQGEIEHCITAWLTKNNWTNVKLKTQLHATIEVTAQKDGLHFFGAGMRSVKDKREIRKYYESKEEDFLNYPAFKQRLGTVFLALVEKMHENENVVTAIFIAGDTPTVDFALQYVKHLNKAGIKVYKVKSVNDITEV